MKDSKFEIPSQRRVSVEDHFAVPYYLVEQNEIVCPIKYEEVYIVGAKRS